MPFPDAQRVIYKINPLERVICQLRFPPILKIDAEIPAVFQDRVRGDYSTFRETSQSNFPIPQNLKDQIPVDVLKQIGGFSGEKNYEFSSEDSQWTINLSRTFIALSTTKYQRWAQFKEKLNGPLSAFIDIYSPAFFSRIGLRYVNVIKRSALGLNNCDWSELLQPYVLGVVTSPLMRERILNLETNHEIQLSDQESRVRIVTRLVKSVDGDEQCYMIDSDLFNNSKKDTNQAIEKLDYLNQRASRLIRWCITDRLDRAMEPEAL